MASFFWNMRGFNKSVKHRVVKEWLKDKSMLFGCLIETRVKEGKAEKIVKEGFNEWSFMANYEYNRLGRIWILWRSGLRITPVYKSAQLISCLVLLPGQREEFVCSFIYAYNTMEERKELWEDLRSHHEAPLLKNKKWILMGDFNEVLEGEEHSGFSDLPRVTSGMRDFQDAVRTCKLMDMGYQGTRFTWCNKREEGLICKKLDRVLINEEWLHSSKAYSVFESGGCSDHARCRIQLAVEEKKKRRPFKFSNVIATVPEFLPLMEAQWGEYDELFHSTSAMFRLTKQLKSLKQPLRQLSKLKLGDIIKKTKEAYRELCVCQKNTLENPSADMMRDEIRAQNRWQRLADMEEEYLKQKSKLFWLDSGDGNNKAFHNAVKIREVRNAIREIRCEDGSVVKDDEGIKKEAERFFTDFMTSQPANFEGATYERRKDLLEFQCSETDCARLVREVTREEIKEVIFKMPTSKSPGPDGFTSEFFREAWSVIGNDIVVAIQSFFLKGFLPKGINSTILALIPKKEEAFGMKDYRPISCCNVLYKAISKILANRLKSLLPQCITLNQSAFITERLLMENVLLATEVVKDYHKDNISSRCAMKIAISKAFDSVQWGFLLNMLQALGIPDQFIHWISLCVTTASFSVQINGELAGYFQSKRGLRQGCSLSPYLFVLCMNVLSRMLDKAVKDGRIGYHPRCKNIKLTHLCFADDLMVFADGTKRSVEGILEVFEDFDKMSGLKISMEKSTLFMAGTATTRQYEILDQFPFETGKLPVRYLGLPLLTKNMTVSDFLPLIEKIRKRINSWTSRYLSYAGRLQLIKSVITSLTNFWMAAFKLPSGCLKEIEKLCSAYLWSGPDLNGKKAKIAWKDVCREKEEGGIGLRPLKKVNKVCCLKLLWRLLSAKSLWVNWIKTYLIRKGSIWMMKENTQGGSWMWRKILKHREIAKNLFRVELKNGRRTSFWSESWSSLGCLKDLLNGGGQFDLGISLSAGVAECLRHRRRNHRMVLLNKIEDEIEKFKRSWVSEEDVPLWKDGKGRFKRQFSSKDTWEIIREKHVLCSWSETVWFKHATPKYSFILWIASHDRLSTGDRMRYWNANVDTSCILCQDPMETKEHLFFECTYSTVIWKKLMEGVLGNEFTVRWEELFQICAKSGRQKIQRFIIKYALQLTVYSIWRERNRRRHGETALSCELLAGLIEKNMRNRLSTIQRKGDSELEGGLRYWFSKR